MTTKKIPAKTSSKSVKKKVAINKTVKNITARTKKETQSKPYDCKKNTRRRRRENVK